MESEPTSSPKERDLVTAVQRGVVTGGLNVANDSSSFDFYSCNWPPSNLNRGRPSSGNKGTLPLGCSVDL